MPQPELQISRVLRIDAALLKAVVKIYAPATPIQTVSGTASSFHHCDECSGQRLIFIATISILSLIGRPLIETFARIGRV